MRIGFIGAGTMAGRHLASLAHTGERIEVVGHVSRNPDRAKAAAEAFGGTALNDPHALLALRPDAVFVTVPPDGHGTIELDLIAAGIPFLVEKPIGLGSETPRRIAQAIDQSGLVVAVGYNWRALTGLDTVRSILAAEPARLALGQFHVGIPPAPWWRRHSQSGGQLVEQACHLIDLARNLLGEGRLIAATGNFDAMPGYPDADIAGASAALFSFGRAPVTITATCLLPGGPGAHLRIIAPGREIVITLAGIEIIEAGQSRRLPGGETSYVRQTRAFLAAVRSGQPSGVCCTYADALKTHALCLAAATDMATTLG